MDGRQKDIKKILVVDDNQDNRELVVKVLKNKGYEMIEAVDGEDALHKVRLKGPPLSLWIYHFPRWTAMKSQGG